MTISSLVNRLLKFTTALIFTLSGMILLTACGEAESEKGKEGVVEVTAMHDAEQNRHLFEMSTHEIPSGWTTFEFNNASGYDHFFLIWKVPQEGIEAAGDSLIDHWHRTITQPFQQEFNPYINGDIDFAQFTQNLVGKISETAPWFLDPGAQTMGGPGFTAAGTTSATTVNLGPGEYVVECYVKNEEEVFHSSIGMLEHMSVSEDSSGVEEPEPTTRLTISSGEGIQFDPELKQGKHIFEIYFEDQTTYANLQGHNVQLVRLSDKDDEELLGSLSDWMDWRQAGSLVNRAPEGAEFMGGSMEMTGGKKAYYHVDLKPGDYTWISEVPDAADHNMLKPFTITGNEAADN